MRKHGSGTFIRNADGTLSWKGWVLVEGEKVRQQFHLGTDVMSVAEAKVKKLREGIAPAEDAAAPETFAEAALRIVENQRIEGVVSWKQRIARLKKYAFPAFGALRIERVRAEHIKDALRAALAAGKSKSLIDHLRDDCSSVLGTLWEDGRVAENVALKAPIPENAPEDQRLHTIPTDDELVRLMSSGLVDIEVLAFAVCSRAVGGQRTSDMLIGADWENLDTDRWQLWRVYRPKTKSWDLLEIPPAAVGVLRDWWERSGRPSSGPLFPVTRGKRKGEKRKPGSCFAERLRRAFWVAGIRRPLPGYELAKTDAERRKLCAFQVDTKTTRRLGAHDLRRAYVTAINRAGAQAARSMKLAGHSSWATHQRYLDRDVVLVAPEGSIPDFSSPKSLPSPVPYGTKSYQSSEAVVKILQDDADPDEDAPRGQKAGRLTEMQNINGLTSYGSSVRNRIRPLAGTNESGGLSGAVPGESLTTEPFESLAETKGDLIGYLASLRHIDKGGRLSCTAAILGCAVKSISGQRGAR